MVLQPDSIRRMALDLCQVATELAKYRAVTVSELEKNLTLRWTVCGSALLADTTSATHDL